MCFGNQTKFCKFFWSLIFMISTISNWCNFTHVSRRNMVLHSPVKEKYFRKRIVMGKKNWMKGHHLPWPLWTIKDLSVGCHSRHKVTLIHWHLKTIIFLQKRSSWLNYNQYVFNPLFVISIPVKEDILLIAGQWSWTNITISYKRSMVHSTVMMLTRSSTVNMGWAVKFNSAWVWTETIKYSLFFLFFFFFF